MMKKSYVNLSHNENYNSIHNHLPAKLWMCTYVSSDHISRFIILKIKWWIVGIPCQRDMFEEILAITNNNGGRG